MRGHGRGQGVGGMDYLGEVFFGLDNSQLNTMVVRRQYPSRAAIPLIVCEWASDEVRGPVRIKPSRTLTSRRPVIAPMINPANPPRIPRRTFLLIRPIKSPTMADPDIRSSRIFMFNPPLPTSQTQPIAYARAWVGARRGWPLVAYRPGHRLGQSMGAGALT